MESTVRDEPQVLPEINMNRIRFYYLKSEIRRQLDALLQELLKGRSEQDFQGEINRLLPIEAKQDKSVKRRVEGMFYISERLWAIGLDMGKKAYGDAFSRQDLWRSTHNLPMSHYRYLTGSREPVPVLITRDDAIEDPSTGLAKLGRDIEALLDFIRDMQDKLKGLTDQTSP